MKNNITLHILLCGLVTAAGTIVAMDNPLAITPQSSPTGSPRNNNNNDETVIIPLLDFSNSQTTISPKKSPRNPVISRENTPRTPIANAQQSSLSSPRDKLIISQVLVQQSSSSPVSPIHSPSVSGNSNPRETKVNKEKLQKTLSGSSSQSSNGHSDSSSYSDSERNLDDLRRTISREQLAQNLNELKKNSDFDDVETSDKGKKEDYNNTQRISFTSEQLLPNITIYQGSVIGYNWIQKTITIQYKESEKSFQSIEIPYLDNNQLSQKYMLVEDQTKNSLFAIELPRANQDSKLGITNPAKREETISNNNNNNIQKERVKRPSHNGKNPVYTVIGGLTFASFMVLLAYHYNKLPEALMNFFDRVVALSPLRR